MVEKVDVLKGVQCWKIVLRPTNQRFMQTKSVLKQKRDGKGEVFNYEALLVVCGNEEVDCNEETFSPVTNHFVIKLLLCFSIQKEWPSGNLDFEDEFSNSSLSRAVDAEFPKQILPNTQTNG